MAALSIFDVWSVFVAFRFELASKGCGRPAGTTNFGGDDPAAVFVPMGGGASGGGSSSFLSLYGAPVLDVVWLAASAPPAGRPSEVEAPNVRFQKDMVYFILLQCRPFEESLRRMLYKLQYYVPYFTDPCTHVILCVQSERVSF